MRIGILGAHKSFGINRIGGTDSLFRRLSRQWVSRGHQMTFVTYRCPMRQSHVGWHGIAVEEFVEFRDALGWLEHHSDVIIVNTLHRNNRLGFARFRRRERSQKRFFIFYTLFRENALWRQIYFLESILSPYQDGTFGVSPRLAQALGRWTNKTSLVWPPVGHEFFCRPEEKPSSGEVRVTYIGRTERGKGIDTVIAIMKRLRGVANIRLDIHGYHFPGDQEAHQVHDWLSQQDWLSYHHRDIHTWSPQVDLDLATTLQQTDILLLPYEKLSSSIDTPLLLLEGMASSCCVVTKPFGDIPNVYGQSPLLISHPDYVSSAAQIIKSADQWLDDERRRVFKKSQQLQFDERTVANHVLELIEKS